MKTTSKKIGVYAIIGLLIVGAILILPAMNLQNFGIQAIGQTNYLIVGKTTATSFGTSGNQYVHDKIRGKTVLQGIGTICSDKYVGSWYKNGDSEKIALTGNLYSWNARHDYIGVRGKPDMMIGRYWWEGWFTPASGGAAVKIFDRGWYDAAYVRLADDSAIKSWGKQKFATVEYYTHTTSDTPDDDRRFLDSAISDGTGDNTWWVNYPIPFDYTKSSTPLQTPTTIFVVLGAKSGTINVKLHLNYAELYIWGNFNSVFGYASNTAVVQEKTFELDPGVGDVDATSKNSLSNVPGYGKMGDGTQGDQYTSYVYQEGQTVTFHYKVGTSGKTNSNPNDNALGWKFEILKGTTSKFSKTDIADESEGDVTYTIPVGSFVPGDTAANTWNYVLTNGLLKQSEGFLFVVDTLNKIPGRTTVTTTKSEYLIGESVSVTLQASPNPNTNSPITSFYVWAKYGSTTRDDYVKINGISGPVSLTNLQNSGTYVTTTFSFTPSKTGSIYIRANCLDKGGYAGAENQPDKLVVIKDVPHYQLTVIAKDKTTGAAIGNVVVSFNGVTGQTGSDGSAILSVEGGSGTLTISKVGYTGVSRAETVTSTRTIYVLLTSTGGEPQDVIIDVYDKTDSTKIAEASVTLDTVTDETDADGAVTFTAVAAGSHSLSVSKTGYDAFTYSLNVPAGLTGGRYAVLLQLTGGTGGGDEGGDDHEPGTAYQITIEVIDKDTTEYVADASISIGTDTKVTDAFGSQTFDLTADTYTITVTKAGYADKTETLDVTETTYHPVYVTKQGGTDGGGGTASKYDVVVNVADSSGAVAGATVQIGTDTQTTGPSGSLTFSVLAGDQYLTVTHPDYQFYSEVITVSQAAIVPVAITKGTTPEAGQKCTVVITVKNSKDKSLLNGVSVSLGGVTAKTSNGIATIQIDSGQYSLMIAKSGFNPLTRNIPVNTNMAFTQELVQTTGGSTPGFEFLGLIAALGIAFIIYRKRRHSQ